MLKRIVVCDVCRKENDRFLVKAIHSRSGEGWTLDNSKDPGEGVHVCSKECALKHGTPQVRGPEEEAPRP
jgi:hypothetical protein